MKYEGARKQAANSPETTIALCVVGSGFACASLYFAYFAAIRGFVPGDADSWAQFGDYLGGVVNPIVGIATALLVVLTLKATRSEASETRAAMDGQRREIERQTELLRSQVGAASTAGELAERRRRLEGLLEEWNQMLDRPRGVIPVVGSRLAAQAGPTPTTLRAFFSDPMTQTRIANAKADNSIQAQLDELSVLFSEVLFLLDEFVIYLDDYDKVAKDTVLSDFYRRRTNSAARVLADVGLLEPENVKKLTKSLNFRAFL